MRERILEWWLTKQSVLGDHRARRRLLALYRLQRMRRRREIRETVELVRKLRGDIEARRVEMMLVEHEIERAIAEIEEILCA